MRQQIENLLYTIQNFIRDRKRLFGLLICMALIYLLILVASVVTPMLKVFELAFIFALIGMTPAYMFRKVFPFNNIIGWLTNASVFGIVFTPLFFLLFGWLQINFVFVHSISLLRIFAAISVLALFVLMKKELIGELISFNGLNIVDYFFYSVILMFTAILTLQNMTNYYPRWDDFTYWGLDAKYIFNLNRLHGMDLDVFWFFKKESSFLTILFSLVYDLYGKVVEQFASWINVFLGLISMLLVYNLSYNKSVFQKLLIVTAMIVVGFTADDTAFMYSLYGDTASAFLFLVFVLLLTADSEYDSKNYGKRLFLLLLIPLSFYLLKSRFLFLTIILPIVVLIYDFRYLKVGWKSIIRTPAFIVCSLLLLLLGGLFIRYQTTTMESHTFTTGVSAFFQSSKLSLVSYFTYAKELLLKLFNFSRYVTVLWTISMISIVFVKKPFRNKGFIYSYLLTFFGFLIFVLAFINKQVSLTSGSLIRYTSLVMFVIPAVFAYSDYHVPSKLLGKTYKKEDINTLRIILISMLTFVVVFLFNHKLIKVAPKGIDFQFVTGSFISTMSKQYKLAQKALSIVEEDARILITDDYFQANIAMNQNQAAIFVRYFLMENSVGGQYRTTLEHLIPYAEQFQADYILLLTYDNSFANCENLMEAGKDYLISLGKEIVPEDNVCLFSDNTIYELSEP